jgi:hypothetical protein
MRYEMVKKRIRENAKRLTKERNYIIIKSKIIELYEKEI